jgi:hypothetical protein
MAAASANKPGIGGRVYRNTGSHGTPVWTHLDRVLSVTPSMPWDYVEAGSRGTRAKLYMQARADLQIQAQVKADDADAGYLALRNAASVPGTVVDLMVLDGLISIEGVHGWRGEFLVSLSSAPQEADGSIYDTFDLKPTFTTNAAGPSTVVMGASSTPTFTAL